MNKAEKKVFELLSQCSPDTYFGDTVSSFCKRELDYQEFVVLMKRIKAKHTESPAEVINIIGKECMDNINLSLESINYQDLYVGLLILSETTVEIIETLRGTNLFANKLKLHASGLEKELLAILHTDLLPAWDDSIETMYPVMNAQKDVAKLLGAMAPELWPELRETIMNFIGGVDKHNRESNKLITSK